MFVVLIKFGDRYEFQMQYGSIGWSVGVTLALDGLIAIIQGMAERITNGSANSEYSLVNLDLL